MIIRKLTSANDAAYRLTIASAWDWPTDHISATGGLGTPGSEAWRARQARLKAKGKLKEDETTPEQAKPEVGQRQQPVSAKRAKKKKK